MRCPACENNLTRRAVADVTLDVCDNGCGGIWFDRLEIKKFDEPMEPDAESLLHLQIKRTAQKNSEEARKCPRCANRILMRHFSSLKRKVAVDECPECAGFWLDAGELHEIRNEYNSEAERSAAAEALFDEAFANVPKTDVQKIQRMANALKFLAPSFYLSKK